MASDRASLVALRELIADTDLTLETNPDLPQNGTALPGESTRGARPGDDLLKQRGKTAAVILGHKGGSTTAEKLGSEHYRQMAPSRKKRDGGRARRQAE